MDFAKNNRLIILVLLATLIKGTVWAYVVPPFQAPDEQFHYASVQYYAEPAGYQPKERGFPLGETNLFDIRTQNISPELRDYLEKINFDKTRFDPNFKADFENYLPFRNQLSDKHLSRFIERYPAWITGYSPLYYKAGALIENASSGFGLAERSFFIRLLSVAISVLFITFVYLIFRELYLDKPTSAILAAAVSFQPMLTFIMASVNVDALLFASYGAFLWGAVRILRKNLDWIGVATAVVGSAISIETKPPGYFTLVILPFLFVILALKNRGWIRSKIKCWGKLVQALAFTSSVILLFFVFIFPGWLYWNLLSKGQPLNIVDDYILRQLQYPVLLVHSRFYWGSFGWLAIQIHQYFIYALWVVMAVAFLGIVKYLYQVKKRRTVLLREEKDKIIFLQVIFLTFCVSGFFLMIHTVNFLQINPANVADESGAIAIQGRYFFPVIAAKFYLIFFGISAMLPNLKKRLVALFLFSLMLALNLVGLFLYIIPRYYF